MKNSLLLQANATLLLPLVFYGSHRLSRRDVARKMTSSTCRCLLSAAVIICSILAQGSFALPVRLSNLRLPLDSSGNQMLSGETSVLKVNGTYYFYVNNWGGCPSVDCCPSEGGCASCCYVPPTEKYPDACVFTQNHSVYVYSTTDFRSFDNLGVVLDISDRPKGIEFRPHVVNPQHDLYVMWFENRPSPINSSGYSIATSKSPLGPFVTKKVNVDVSGVVPGDFDVLIDDTDGTCWHVQTTTNDPAKLNGFVVTQLNGDCMDAMMPKKQVVFHSPKPAEGPVFFKRGSTYYILAGTTCCACRGGSSIYVFSSSSPLGPWKYNNDVGSNTTHGAFDPHSPYSYITRAQASAVFSVENVDGTSEYIWFGNQWTTSPRRNSDLVYWSIIEWEEDGLSIKPFVWQDEIELNLRNHKHGSNQHVAEAKQASVPFGHNVLQYFALNKSYINLNHGSYGATSLSVLKAAESYEMAMEQRPDEWFRYVIYDKMDELRKVFAKYINADPDEIVFVPNASHGVNAILRSLKIKLGEKILFLNVAYTMVKNTIKYLHNFNDDSLLQVDIKVPGTKDSILDAVRTALENNKGAVKVASFSHIVSLPAMVLPIKELIQLCHQYGVLVLIDGAHALGQISLDMKAYNADFYVGNGHKWLYSPKGSAVLYVRKDVQSLIEPTTISWEGSSVYPSHFQKAFAYQGTSSYSPYLAMNDALVFREFLGGEKKIHQYMHELAVKAGHLMAKIFKTNVLFEDDSSRYAAMVDVRLPTQNETLVNSIPLQLLSQYDTWVPTYDIGAFGGAEGEYYVRVSCQVYNEISDIEFLANAILAIILHN